MATAFSLFRSDTHNGIPSLELRRPIRHELAKSLEACGMSHYDASDAAEKAGGSLTVLKRTLSRFPATTQPEWSHGANATELVHACLPGVGLRLLAATEPPLKGWPTGLSADSLRRLKNGLQSKTRRSNGS